jgi:hypothetical protein
MIECRWLPGGSAVADGAIMIKVILYMIRVGYSHIIGLMTRVAVKGRILVAISMAAYTLKRYMGAS